MKNLLKLLTDTGDALIYRPSEKTSVMDSVNKAIEDRERDGYVSKRFSPGGYVCARYKAHERLNDFEPRMTAHKPDTIRLFKAGNSVHEVFQQEMLSTTDQLFGHWVCASCGTKRSYTMRPQGVCGGSRIQTSLLGEKVEEKCADVLKRTENKWRYEELYVYSNPLDNDLYALSGFVDGIWVEGETWFTLEIKSIDDLGFKALNRVKHPELEGHFVLKPTDPRYPMNNHIDQGMVYSKMLIDLADEGKLPFQSTEFKGLILLYVNRDTFETKEFRIDYSARPYKTLLSLATAAKGAVEQKNAFLAPAKCSSANTVLAKRCPLRYQCFPKKK